MLNVGIDSAAFDPSMGWWEFYDRFPPLEGCGRRREDEDDRAVPVGELEQSRERDAEELHRAAEFAAEVMGSVGLGAGDAERRGEWVGELARAVEGVRNVGSRTLLSETVLALRRLLAAESPGERINAEVKLRACLRDPRFEDAKRRVERALDRAVKEAGVAEVVVLGNQLEDGGIAEAQLAAYGRLRGELDVVCGRVLGAVLEVYRERRENLWMFPEDYVEVEGIEGLCELLEFVSLTVHAAREDGRCDLGFSFECAWDAEHGLGVRVRADGRVEVGGQDVAFDEWA